MAGQSAGRLFGAVAAAQVLAVGAVVGADAIKKRDRFKRSGFLRPGSFEATVDGTAKTVYTDGETLFEDMRSAIRCARERVRFETYLWKADDVGAQFRDVLNAAARRGVEVFVIYDAFGNLVVPGSFFAFRADVHVFRFFTVHPSLLLGAARLAHSKLS